MDSAIDLIKHFFDKTSKICSELNTFEPFKYKHFISATIDFHTIEVIKLRQLKDISGFFLATAEFKSKNLKFVINYGDIDYGLFYTIYIDGKRYSYYCYTHALLKEESTHCSTLRSIESIDTNLDRLEAVLKKTYPLLLKKKKYYIRKMDKYTEEEKKKEQEQEARETVASQLRRASVLFVENNYSAAYEIYKEHERHLTSSDFVKMEHCIKYK